MTDAQYKSKMDTVVQALNLCAGVLDSLTDEDLNLMFATLARAESVGHLFVIPIDYHASMERVQQQREALNVAVQVRKWRRGYEPPSSSNDDTTL